MLAAKQNDDVPTRLLNAALDASRSIPEPMRPAFLKALSEHHHRAADMMASAAIRLEGRSA